MKKKHTPSGAGFSQPENSKNDISIINFENVKFRIAKIGGEPWFVAVGRVSAGGQ